MRNSLDLDSDPLILFSHVSSHIMREKEIKSNLKNIIKIICLDKINSTSNVMFCITLRSI